MIVDKMENLKLYGVLPAAALEKIQAFAQEAKRGAYEVGKYPLEGEALYALVQSYHTKPEEKCRPEAHIKYIDLQYILEGRERMYCDFVHGLEVDTPYREENDICFYTKSKKQVSIVLEEDMFVFLYPSDVHSPCCRIGESSPVKKIVFKILAEHKA